MSSKPTRLDGRTRIARRARKLLVAFAKAVGKYDDLVIAHAVTDAAELCAIAEDARARFMRGEDVSLDDLVRIERAAALAVKRLNLKPSDAPKAPDLDSYLESKRSASCT